jgi:predicted RND superfamily exporter protein
VPLAIVVWTFYFFDFKLNLLTAMTTVVCIGLLDDDTIHILYRKFILKQAPESLTYSIMNTAILLAVGFGLFTLSNFTPTRIFGGVSALVFVFGIIGELTLFQWVLDKIKKDETDE